MISLKTLLASLAVLTPLTRAATLECGLNVAQFNIVDLVDFQAAMLANEFPPTEVKANNLFNAGRNFNSDVRFRNLHLCIQNDFVFESTTVFPDEMASLLQLYLDCHRSLAAGNEIFRELAAGTLDGDTSLDVGGKIQFIGEPCF